MLEHCDFHIVCGGYYECNPGWNAEKSAIDMSLKFWLPVEGEAYVVINGVERVIKPGAVYYMYGYEQERHRCPSFMSLCWIHCVPEDLYTSHLLSYVPAFYHWPLATLAPWVAVFERLPELFEKTRERGFALLPQRPASLVWRVQSLVLFLVSDLVEFRRPEGESEQLRRSYQELRPAIDFMDREFAQAPDLATVAGHVHMSPGGFHRKFSQAFKVTPHDYIMRKRLNMASQLLLTTDLSIEEVAYRSGFNDPYYFSKVFKRQSGVSPSRVRASRESDRGFHVGAPGQPA